MGVVLLLAALALGAQEAAACTTLCILDGQRIVFGKNYDWYVAEGALLVNQRGVTRIAHAPGDRAARWQSLFGSVTFNQYGRDQPAGGINEAGLVVELMWLNGTGYPAPDARPATGGGTGWIQYQLDTAGSVAELIASEPRIRIPRSGAPLHFLVADRKGEVAVIEFRDGRMSALRGAELPAPALANDFYADSLAGLRQPGAQSRFARAAKRALDYRPGGDPVRYVFDALDEVAQGKQAIAPAPPAQVTRWSIVYEVDRQRVHFRTREHPAVKRLSLESLDFSCAPRVLGMDIQQAEGGDVKSRLSPFTVRENLTLLRATYAQTEMLKQTPPAEIGRIAALPDSSPCRKHLRARST